MSGSGFWLACPTRGLRVTRVARRPDSPPVSRSCAHLRLYDSPTPPGENDDAITTAAARSFKASRGARPERLEEEQVRQRRMAGHGFRGPPARATTSQATTQPSVPPTLPASALWRWPRIAHGGEAIRRPVDARRPAGPAQRHRASPSAHPRRRRRSSIARPRSPAAKTRRAVIARSPRPRRSLGVEPPDLRQIACHDGECPIARYSAFSFVGCRVGEGVFALSSNDHGTIPGVELHGRHAGAPA